MVNRRGRVRLSLIVAVAVPFLQACTGGGASERSSSAIRSSTRTAAQTTSTTRSAPNDIEASQAQRSTGNFHPTGLQVVEVAQHKGFIRAYNAGDLASAIAQFSRTSALGFSDCDYSLPQLVDGHGRGALVAWLRRSAADHDRLTIGEFAVTPPNQLGVLGVAFSRRTGDAITRAGHPNGIRPSTGAKIKFDNAGLITEFNNGPFGGTEIDCHLS